MSRVISRIRALLGRRARRGTKRLSPAQAQVLRRNLRAILDTKEHLAEQRESAA
jgi:hypothetical protein